MRVQRSEAAGTDPVLSLTFASRARSLNPISLHLLYICRQAGVWSRQTYWCQVPGQEERHSVRPICRQPLSMIQFTPQTRFGSS